MFARELSSLMGGRLIGEDVQLLGLAPLYGATSSDLSFMAWPKDGRLAKKTSAGAIIAPSDWVAEYADECQSALIAVGDIAKSFAVLADLQSRDLFKPWPRVISQKISPGATLCKSARVGLACIGDQTKIGSFSMIGDDVVIGQGSIIGSHVVIEGPARIGDNCVIGSSSVIGAEAFVPLFSAMLPSLGGVLIENDVSLGALCSVAKGLIGQTTIRQECRLDNMVHCGHDVIIGRGVAIAAQSGLAGFVQVGDGVSIGGQSGVAPHVVIEHSARLSGKSFAHKNMGAFEVWSGNPSLPHALYLREYARAKRA
jgi:UDP-3-O-[3-hydroxymyristoyl] glucosamine N-acyltransferase